MTITLGNIAAGATVDIRYVVLVAAGAQPGSAVNSAQAIGNALAKRIGVDTVVVVPGKYSELPGRLIADKFDEGE